MTRRSPKQQPKSSTISRRIRNRADHSISIQPPKHSPVVSLRSRRAVASTSPRHISVNYQTEEAHTPVWDPTVATDPFTRSNSLHPPGTEQNEPPSLHASPSPEPLPYLSSQISPSDPLAFPPQSELEHFGAQSIPSADLLTSPSHGLPDDDFAVDYQLRVSQEPSGPAGASVEFRDMR
jgi:hypothetical protein